MSRPTVTATHQTDRFTDGRQCGTGYTSPGITLEVDFELHDHEAALALLDRAVDDVRAQIAETAPNPKPHIVAICNSSDFHASGCDCGREGGTPRYVKDDSARAMLDETWMG